MATIAAFTTYTGFQGTVSFGWQVAIGCNRPVPVIQTRILNGTTQRKQTFTKTIWVPFTDIS